MKKIKLVKTITKLATITMVMAIVPSHAGTVISGNANSGSGNDTTNTAKCTHGSVVFAYTGSPQYFTITPEMRAYGKLCFTLYGASGGNTLHFLGGNGGVTTAVLPLQNFSSNMLTIIVGAAGRDIYGSGYSGADGGGGTFVCNGSFCSKDTVLLVAGGGGGACESFSYYNGYYYYYGGGHGGHGGGVKGGDGTGPAHCGMGGTNISGGLGYSGCNGGNGYGGGAYYNGTYGCLNGKPYTSSNGGRGSTNGIGCGGGGGGWYGGGSGGGFIAGGGGGSGYCNPIFGQIPGAFCTTDFSNHRGNGHVIISW